MVLAVETQSNLSVQVMNSVGLKSGFLAVLMALVLSSSFWEMVDLMVLAAGSSISLAAGLLAFIALGLLEEVDEAEELEEDEDEVEDEAEEQLLLSESESLLVVVCPGMLPVVLSVSMCGLSEVKFVECVVFVCVSFCLWISASLSPPTFLAARGRAAGSGRGRCCSFEGVAVLLFSFGLSNRSL